jgi:hypothetical protein
MLAPASRGGEANMGLAEDELRAIEARWLSPVAALTISLRGIYSIRAIRT